MSGNPKIDPTVLTTQQLDKGLENLKQLLEARIAGIEKAAGDVGVIKERQARHKEQLISVNSRMELQFLELDKRMRQSSQDSKVAIDAALQAAKEAVSEQNKSNEKAIMNLTPANAATAALAVATLPFVTGTATTMVLNTGTVGLPIGTYLFNYHASGY